MQGEALWEVNPLLLTTRVLLLLQASQRGKAAAPTQPDPDDPLREQYGDTPLVQSRTQSGKKYYNISELSPELSGQTVSLLQCPKQCSSLACGFLKPHVMRHYS